MLFRSVFEKEEKAGGVIRYVIPGFRISDDAIDKDVSFIQKMVWRSKQVQK